MDKNKNTGQNCGPGTFKIGVLGVDVVKPKRK
jgi:hypothetical protein